MTTERKTYRCAVYTRKSSDNNLDLEFNSLDAQREAAEAYIKSQAHEGWRLIRTAYDDGGISGGTMERPALQRLLDDVRAGAIDIIVVYKVDRLTRSLADFARLVDLFERNAVSFVSVTQQFNTTTSMGRLTLNVLLSFAQFEREVAGERIRDKVAASRRKGIWMGGTVPFGYVARDKKLVPSETAAPVVRAIFERAKALGGITALREELTARSELGGDHATGVVVSPSEVSATAMADGRGKSASGAPASPASLPVPSLSRGALYYLLRNRTYVGEARHRQAWYPADHVPIVHAALFDDVQRLLDENRVAASDRRIESEAPLAGLIYDDRGNKMSPSWTSKRGGRYRYYVSQALLQGRKEEAGSRPRVAAVDLEGRVFAALARYIQSGDRRAETIEHPGLEEPRGFSDAPATQNSGQGVESGFPGHLAPTLMNLAQPTTTPVLSLLDRPPSAQDLTLMAVILRVVVRSDAIDIEIRDDGVDALRRGLPVEESATPDDRNGALSATWVTAPLPRRASSTIIEAAGGTPGANNAAAIEMVAKARVWAKMMMRGEVNSFEELADITGQSVGYLRRVIRMAWIAPSIIEGLVQGDPMPHNARKKMLDGLPHRWSEQERVLELKD